MLIFITIFKFLIKIILKSFQKCGNFWSPYLVALNSGAMKDEFLAQAKNCTWDSSNNICRGYGMNDKRVTFGQFHC